MTSEESFAALAQEVRACRICRDAPRHGPALPHEPRPILQGSSASRLCIASQAPGNRAHQSGKPFYDPSGVRLRAWLGLDEAVFYDPARVAIIPMGNCFPGYDAHRGDLPPRRECAETWRVPLLGALPDLELILAIGLYSQEWHLGADYEGLSRTVGRWRQILAGEYRPRILPLPHPSWRNNGWLKRHPWFESELLPVLKEEVARLVGPEAQASSRASRLDVSQRRPPSFCTSA